MGSCGQAAVVLVAETSTGTVASDIRLNLSAGPELTHRVLIVLKDAEALEPVGQQTTTHPRHRPPVSK
jgi:hypothetical protein